MQAELDAAEPLVLKANAALAGLKEDDFKQLKSFTNPPLPIKNCMETVLHLFAGINKQVLVDKKGKVKDEKPWGTLLKMMAKPKEFLELLNTLKGFIDAGTAPPQNFDAIRGTLANPDFTPDRLKKASRAAEGVCDWVINITAYFDVVVLVEPKRIAVREAEARLQAANEKA